MTETYISLRRLENEALRIELDDTYTMDLFNDYIKVSINQFYGIEINDFACVVAKTALWISEAQMMRETENIICQNLQFLPLKSYNNVVEGNALRIDWNEVVDKSELNYIMGNPPFIGASMMTKSQKEEMFELFPINGAGDLDYVCGWYKKSSLLMLENEKIKTALVSTNSICQGEHVGILWKYLNNELNMKINFAHRTFRWDSEASIKAHVHCVIVGFCNNNLNINYYLFDDNRVSKVDKINGYLINADNIFIEKHSKPLSNVTKMIRGSSPCDNGNFSFKEDEAKEFIAHNPELKKYIKKYIGAEEFINRKNRYVLWLVGIEPYEIKNSKTLISILEKVKEFRLSSKKPQTRQLAETPMLWEANRYNGKDFILIPRVSSEKRKYIPIGFIDGDTIANDACQLIPDATIYQFGILTSNVHNAWMRVVAGRLESRYRYSNLVYNSFIWPNPSETQKEKIEKTAQMILDARNLYPNSSLADLYDEISMPVELRKAHQLNDKAVMEAYGFNIKMTESECVGALMEMYKIMMEN